MNLIQGNNIRQATALAWEFWARGWRGQLLGLAGAVGFASLLYGSISNVSDIAFRGTEAGASMHFGFYWVALIFLGSPILAAWGSSTASLHVAYFEFRDSRLPDGLLDGGDVCAVRRGRDDVEFALRRWLADLGPWFVGCSSDCLDAGDPLVDVELPGFTVGE